MLKLRMHGETAEIERMIETVCNRTPNVRVLSVSKPYKDRGASVYERCYMDIEIHEIVNDDNDLVKILEKISYGYNDHYCIDLDEIASAFEDKEIENDSANELVARYLQSKCFGNVEQAVREFAEELKEIYNNLNYLPSGDEFSDLIDELIQERYGK